MKKDIRKARLNAIKEVTPIFWKRCEKCKGEYKREKMYRVDLWGVNQNIWRKYFCQNCTPTKEDVLNISKAYGFCIAYVDEF